MFARTERLLLRPAWPEDAPALAEAIADPAIVRQLAHVTWPYTLDDARSHIERQLEARQPGLLILARTHGKPRLVGGIAIAPNTEHRTATGGELRYWIARAHWGLGYATEAGQAVLRIAFEGLRLSTLAASHVIDNPAAGRVLRKLGFQPAGTAADRDAPRIVYRLEQCEWRSGEATRLAA